jgi:hypothetical protein
MMGRADILLRFLQLAGMDRPNDLDRYTENLDASPEAPPLVVQVTDRILADKPELVRKYTQAWEELHQSNPYAQPASEERNAEAALAFTSFITEWVGLERVMSELFGKARLGDLGAPSPALSRTAISWMVQDKAISPDQRVAINRLRNIRNELVHGRKQPDEKALTAAATEAKNLRLSIEQQLRLAQGNEAVAVPESST